MNPFQISLRYRYLSDYSQGSLLFLSLDTQELLPHWAVNLTNFYCIAPLNTLQQLKDIATTALRNLLLHIIVQQQRIYTRRCEVKTSNFVIYSNKIYSLS